MPVEESSFTQVEALGRAAARPDALLVLDEFGKMELLCDGFEAAATRALDRASRGVGTLPSRRGIAAVEAVRSRPDVAVVEARGRAVNFGGRRERVLT